MAKDLKGKELGKGLSQRKDKRYSARYVSKTGKRIEKYFNTHQEARNWLADARYEDEHGTTGITSNMSVNDWFQYWHDNLISDLSPNTRRNYRERYEKNAKHLIGHASIQTTMDTYVHVTDDSMQKAIKQFEKRYDDNRD